MGIQGCWHRGMVIDTKPLQRIVKYEYLFQSDHPQSPNIVEPVPVSPAIDGILHMSFSQLLNSEPHEDSPQTSMRNNIRPCACRLPIQPSEATYGMCVDACEENVHWEGIILDHSNDHSAQTTQRNVFFPDLGIEESVSLQNLSLSSDWNEITGEWTTRGRWKFLEALEANLERASLCRTMQQLWDIAKSHTYFVSKIGAWTRGTRDEWFYLVPILMPQLALLTTFTSVQSGTFWGSVSDFVEAYNNRSCSRAGNLNQILKEKSDIARSHLKSVGWQFMETEGGAKYFVSAEGTRYNSFIKACEEYLAGKAGPPPPQETAICAVVTGGMSENMKNKGPYGPTSTWNPVNLIPEFSSVLTQGAKYEDVTRDTVRKHLLHLGWIVKYKRDTNRPMTRYRYHSPKGKTYYSLREVFDEFASGFHSWRDDHNEDDQSGSNGHDPNLGTPEENNGENTVLTESVLIDNNILPENLPVQIKEQLGHLHIDCGKLEANKPTGEIQSSPNGDYIHSQQPIGNEGNQLGLNRDSVTNVIQPEYPPESIREYIECIRSNQKGYIAPSNVKSNAKRHLLSAGWTMCIKSTRRVYYRSPSGKSFGSLLQACKAYLMEAFPASGDATTIIQERNIAGETSGSCTYVLMKYGSNDPKREHHSQCAALKYHQGRSKKRKIRDRDPANLIKARKKLTKSKGNFNFYCEAESNSTNSPLTCSKTIISLLINKNLVMPRTRVSYRYMNFTKNGVITSNGIKCICCSKTFSATNFELHVRGASFGGPLANIYLRDGRSLLKCLVEAMETGNLDMQLEESDDHNNDSDVICSACHHDGLLVKCCNCPSAFHSSCVALKVIII